MMFDGAVAATVATDVASSTPTADASHAATGADNSHAAGNNDNTQGTSSNSASHAQGSADNTQAPAADSRQAAQDISKAGPVADSHGGVRKEVVFVDTRVPDYQTLLKDISPDAEVVLLSTDKDGVQQIADALAGRHDIDAIHIISHGDSGVLLLGNGPLFEGNLARYSTQLHDIGQALTADGDILLYGCDVGAGTAGRDFLSQLAGITDADIAASTDATGGSAKGGNWDLEIATGAIAASHALDLARLDSYDHLLVTTSVSSLTALKAAIATGNGDGVDDLITITGDITFTSAADTISINVTDGHTMQIVGGGHSLDGANQAGVLKVATSGAGSKVLIDNIVIKNGLIVGKGANESASATDSLGAGIYNSGVLTITNSTITGNKASGGGGGGGDVGVAYAGGGGGGGGFGTTSGGTGGASTGAFVPATSPSGITGGNGAGANASFGGRGGGVSGGQGGSYSGGINSFGYTVGGTGGTASNGSASIGGGGGGAGASAAGGIGGAAVGGIYNTSTGILTITGSTITNNLGAGGGGGGGVSAYQTGYAHTGNGGTGGAGVGALWNAGGNVRMDAATASTLSIGNAGAGGTGGNAVNGGSNGATGNSKSTIETTGGGTTDTTFVPNATPTLGNLNGDSVAWAGVGNSVVLDVGTNAAVGDAEFGALNGGLGNWSGASLAVQRQGTAVSSDTFGFLLAGASFTVNGANLQSGGATFASFTNVGGVLTINFNSSATTATTALVRDVVQHITYRSDTPAGDANVSVALSDGNTAVTANVVVTSDTIYVTNTSDVGTINPSDGVGLREAIAIAAADSTGTQTIVFSSALSGQTITLGSGLNLGESLVFNADSSTGLTISGSTITLGNGTTLTFSNAFGTVGIASTLAGSGSLNKAGAGTLVLSSASNEASMSGGMTVSGGTLQISDDNYLSSGTLTLDGGRLTNNATGFTIDNAIVLGAGGGTINVGGGAGATSLVLSGIISGTGTLTKNGQAILELSGNNTYSGLTDVQSGTLILSHANALGTTAGSTNVTSGATVRIAGALTVAESFTIAGTGTTVSSVNYGALHLVSGSSALSGTVTFNSDADISAASGSTLTLSGALSGSSNLNKTDAGTLVLSNTANEAGMSGGMTVSAGTLSIGADDNLSSGTLTLAGGTLAASGSTTVDNAVTLTAASTISAAGNLALSGVLSGSAALTKSGAGTLTLSGSNTLSGAVYLSAGGLTLSGGSAIGDGSAVTVTSGTTLTLASAETIGSLAGLGSVVLNAQLTTGGDNTNTTYSGVISGASGLTKAGSGTMTLTGNNLFTGAVSVSAGGLTLNRVGGALSDSASVTVASGATLTISADEAIDSLFGAGTVALGGQSLMVGVNGASSNFSGSITGSGALVQDGTGTLTLSGANSSQGWATRVYDGTLAIANAGNIGTGAIELNGGTLSISNDMTLANTITLSGAGGTLSVAAGKAVGLSASNTGTGGLTKAGSGTLTLSGSNNYLGTTTVSAGTLSVTGSTASATTVASGATLAGSGTLGGNVTVQGGGTLSPGIGGVNNGVGTLTLNGNLQMNAGSTLALDINGTTAGTGYDQLLVNGAVDVTGATLAATHGYVPDSGDSYNVIVNDGADAVTGSFSGLGEGAVLTAGGDGTPLTVSYLGGTGNDITLTAPINAAPVLGNLGGDSVTFTQGSGSILLDGGSDATLTDSDSPDFNGGSLHVSIVANGVSTEDVLGIRNQGTGAGQIGVSGANVTYQGTVIGSVAGGTGGSDLVVSFNANATAAAVQALLRNLSYDNSNASNAIGQSARTVRVTVNDGDSSSTSHADVTVAVIETVPPTATIVVADTSLLAGESSTVTITFSEAVTGLDLGDFTVSHGTLSNLSTLDNITWTATLTPSANFQGGSSHISLNNAGYTDQAGNAGVGTTDSNNYAIDTLRPSATIVMNHSALAVGETATVTITFNRAVTGLDMTDFTVQNGTLGNLSTSDNIVWTATFTPAANIEAGSNVITLANSGVADAVGNVGVGSTSSSNYSIDTLRPTATIVVTNTSLAVGGTSTVTITFSEAVLGLTTADFTVAHGTLSNLSSSNGGITWTATLTPTAGIVSATNLITLDNTGVFDGAGNTGAGTTSSNSYVVDTEAPVNGVPGGQITNTVTPLVFSSANGNAITVSDGGQLTVVVSVAGGALNANAGGTAVITGNGSGSVTLSGTAAEVNAALDGLTYTPDGAGARNISLQSTDSVGNSDTDLVAVTVNNSTLVVTSDLDTGADQSTGASFAADQADGNGLSIREALFWARGGDTITFDLNGALAGSQGGTIILNGAQLDINYSNLKIDGDLNHDGVADVTISGNHASRVMAVGVSVTGVEITGLTLTQGVTGGGGGGLYVSSGSSLTLRDSVISNNTDTGGGGGGLYATASTVTVINSTISGNTSNTFGGGIRVVSNNGALNLINSTVSGNTTTGTGAHGGGLQFGGSNPLVIINSTFSGNAALGASSFGGGIRITSGTAFLYNVTVVGNAATSTGGGINASGSETFVNVVAAGNTSGAGASAAVGGSPLATGGSADDVDGTVETATNSFFGSNVSIGVATGVLNNQGTAGLLLGNLANNGGTVLTHKPQAGSALLHAGSSAALPADTFDLDGDGNTSEALPIDAIGNVRAAGSAVDIGAVQANAAPVLGGLTGGGSYTEGGAAIVIDTAVSVSDADLDALNGGVGDYSGASLLVVRQAGANASDLFGFLAGNGITRVGNTLVKNGQVIASFDTSIAGQLTLTFTHANGQTPTSADVNHILRQLTYANASDDPVASVTLNWTFADDQGATSQGSSLVNLVAVNDAPVVSATGGNPTYTENGSAVDLFSGVSLDTVEAGQSIIGLTFTVSGLTDGASEILRIDGTDIALVHGANGLTSGSGIAYSVSVVGGTASITLTHAGLSAASAQGVIDAMSYRNSSEAPGTGTRSVSLVSVRDSGGTANGGVDTTHVAITANVAVVAVNDAPSISAPGSIAVIEDTPQSLSGISFADADAGNHSVSVHFSVASGTLGASGGAGVAVSGSGTGSLTLVGSIADINAFIAANRLSFTGAANANGNVTLSIGIDDGGNTGTGGTLTDSATVTLAVSAVNDAPVNSVPGTQSLDQDGTLVFNAGNGNRISISDVDVGSGNLQVTLTASHGVLTLGNLAGLSFITGDGTADATLIFTGSLADINNALNGLTFKPTSGYNGPAGLQISTSDLGNSGSGGALVDSDSIGITVEPLNPLVTHIGVGNPNGSYHLGDVITVTVTFDQNVMVDTRGGVPTLLLATGLVDRGAVYLSGSGSKTLTFLYTVQAGDLSADLNQQSSGALALNGGSIRNAGNRDAILTLPAPGGADSIAAQHDIVVDGVEPTVSSVTVPANGTYVAGQNLDFTVNLSEAVTVDTRSGTPLLAITLDGGRTVFAQYISGSGSSALVFRYTVQPGDNDADGIQVAGLSANGGRLSDAAGNALDPSLHQVGDSHAVLVDTRAPSATSVVRLDASPTSAKSVDFLVSFDEDVRGVDSADFSVTTSNSAKGSVLAVTQVDARTWRVTVGDISGQGSLGLTVNAGGISDAAGNLLAQAVSGDRYVIGSNSDGDPQFRITTPSVSPLPSPTPLQPKVPVLVAPPTVSPVLPPSLFEPPSLGGMPPLGSIFSRNGAPAQSFLAQVFGNAGFGDGSARGFLGFGGGDAGVFGNSTLSGLFNRDGFDDSTPLKVFERRSADIDQGLRGIFGAPTLAQQLQQIQETEQQPMRDLAWALGQIAQDREAS
ncbi:Ig-like domain-containing protein [Pseudomonas sp. SCB32]|uniref:Ig-like domain-containing protein n=1 Tax=Pseudomonas sp. SCB32 TaxID=2653853 RepID=UPI0015B750B2|nr:Ig-like domain-containing protein [Pseudomonas sp. SCB32]